MTKISKTILLVFFSITLGAAALAQNSNVEAIGPLSGTLTVNYPPNPCVSADAVSFTGNVHVVVQVNTAQNTMDVHVNLMTVKGTGSYGKYIGNGSASFMDLPFATAQSLVIAADLYPPSPCRAGFTPQGALLIAVEFTLGTDGTLNQVLAVAGPTSD